MQGANGLLALAWTCSLARSLARAFSSKPCTQRRRRQPASAIASARAASIRVLCAPRGLQPSRSQVCVSPTLTDQIGQVESSGIIWPPLAGDQLSIRRLRSGLRLARTSPGLTGLLSSARSFRRPTWWEQKGEWALEGEKQVGFAGKPRPSSATNPPSIPIPLFFSSSSSSCFSSHLQTLETRGKHKQTKGCAQLSASCSWAKTRGSPDEDDHH